MYSVGSIVVKEAGDAYFNHYDDDSDFHLSRHASGETHWKSNEIKILSQDIRIGKPINEFKGIEDLQLVGFGSLDSLQELYKEYKMEKNDGVFCFDLRQYKEGTFNMFVCMLTEEGLQSLLSRTKLLANRQISIFPECHPMIAIIVGGARIETKKSESS
jgi:hypothetical protein